MTGSHAATQTAKAARVVEGGCEGIGSNLGGLHNDGGAAKALVLQGEEAGVAGCHAREAKDGFQEASSSSVKIV